MWQSPTVLPLPAEVAQNNVYIPSNIWHQTVLPPPQRRRSTYRPPTAAWPPSWPGTPCWPPTMCWSTSPCPAPPPRAWPPSCSAWGPAWAASMTCWLSLDFPSLSQVSGLGRPWGSYGQSATRPKQWSVLLMSERAVGVKGPLVGKTNFGVKIWPMPEQVGCGFEPGSGSTPTILLLGFYGKRNRCHDAWLGTAPKRPQTLTSCSIVLSKDCRKAGEIRITLLSRAGGCPAKSSY